MPLPHRILLLTTALVVACGDDSSAVDAAAPDTSALGDSGGSDAEVDSASMDAGADVPPVRDAGDATTPGGGSVSFHAIYESPSAWDTNDAARATVERVFADLSSHLRTSGEWDTTVEVYFTDDNDGNASTAFDGLLTRVFNGQQVRVVPAWANIVQNEDPGEGATDGSGTDFTIHYNVQNHDDNDGLVRHEIMHGLGAVNRVPNFSVTESGETMGPEVGERIMATLYDLHLVDMNKDPILANYDDTDGTFEIQPHVVEETLLEWMDGGGGMFFRGEGTDGPFDMVCGTFPAGPERGLIVLNEPADVMSAAVHPTWDSVEEPDLAFLRAMGYRVVP